MHNHYTLPIDPHIPQTWVYGLAKVWTYDLYSLYKLWLPIGLHLDKFNYFIFNLK